MKIALITGASRGLGKSMALNLAKKETDIILTYNSNQGEAEKVVNEIEGIGRKAIALHLDVSQHSSFDTFTTDIGNVLKSKWGRENFDFLINNAGIGIHAGFMETSEEQFDQVMNINLKGPFFLNQKLIRLIKDGGHILNVSSGLARFSLPGFAAYASMKGGMEVLTRYMAKELGPRGISVNIIAPGAIETDFGGGAVRDNKDMNKFIASQTAKGRAGLPDDIGSAVATILCGDCMWITGQRIEISGGMFL